mmetsp:Transcript_1736/g.2403  ORF Transcript_1736/g.2403 Transcript_1736/m.2403 type:complete len:576 (-) Transcript_1736:146-1873(-)
MNSRNSNKLDDDNNNVRLTELSPLPTEDVDMERENNYGSVHSSSSSASSLYQIKPSRNIPLILSYTFLMFVGLSLWSQSILSAFVYLLDDRNPQAVGYVTSISGISQLAASFPSGYLADKYRRDVSCKVASVIGIVAVAWTIFTIQYSLSYLHLCIALGLHGCFWGTANTSLMALFADSIQDGDRSYYFTRRAILTKLGNAAGPVTALILFFLWGDTWTLHDCANVMTVGQCVVIPAAIILCFLSDDHIATEPTIEGLLLQDEEDDDNYNDDEDNVEEGRETTNNTHLDKNKSTVTIPQSQVCTNDDLEEETTSLQQQQSSSNDQEHHDRDEYEHCLVRCMPSHRTIPVLITMSDVCNGLGAGMSFRYYPIFFVKHLNLSPVKVQILYLVSPLLQTFLMSQGQKWSKRQQWGRCRIAAIYRWIGAVCMIGMILSYSAFHMPIWVTCAFFVIRTAFVNSTNPLTRSVLMDHVPKHERGKWSALESVNMVSWSGSAALGGALVKFEGILFNFWCTMGMQLLATIPLVLLFEKDQEQDGTTATRTISRSTTATSTSTTVLVDQTEERRETSSSTSSSR